MDRSIFHFFMFLFMCALLIGCGEKDADEEASRYDIAKTYEKDDLPITVWVKISDKSLTTADLLEYVIEIEQGKGVKAEHPKIDELDFGQFIIRGSRRTPEKVGEDGTSTFGIVYTLEPELPGEYVIQPFDVIYSIDGEEPEDIASGVSHSIRTESFKIEVESLLEKDAAVDMKPIQGPVALPKKGMDRRRLAIIFAATAVAIALIAGVIIFGRRWKAKEIKKRIPPHKVALEALKRLREKKLIEKGLVKEFYYEISNIMRHYIEDRFGLSAPEQTTDEFLSSISRDGYFHSGTQDLLKSFLEHCDLVKFARYVPETDEINRTFNVTRDFIEQTKQEVKDAA